MALGVHGSGSSFKQHCSLMTLTSSLSLLGECSLLQCEYCNLSAERIWTSRALYSDGFLPPDFSKGMMLKIISD